MGEGLFTYGTLETVEVPASGPGAANDAVAKAPLGALLRWNGKVYRYVKFDNGSGNVASVAYGVAVWKTLTMPTATTDGVFTVTMDWTDTLGGKNAVAGIFGGVVTDGYYTWIQVGGTCTAKTAASTVAGDMCTGSTNDGIFARIAEAANVTDCVYALALSARNGTAGTNTVLLQNLIW